MIDEAQVFSTLAAQSIIPDATQRHTITTLLALLKHPARRNRLTQAVDFQGVYCHGLPGRGKSLVVDTVFALAHCTKRRVHFHAFLREMNQRLVREVGSDDRLASVSRHWLDGVELLCFDEFHVHDIADAFLIGRFLEVALELGTRVVLTSNFAPQDLLPDPEFHARFQATIERIERHFAIVHFDGQQDYRLSGALAEQARTFSPLDATNAEALRILFLRYETEACMQADTLTVAGRAITVRAAGKALLWIDFDALCLASRSHLDYLDMAERCQGLIIDRLLTHWLATPQTLQRFIWLIDIFYDRRHAVFIASDQPLLAALHNLEGVHDLSRTLSRLADMQSCRYKNPLDDIERSSEDRK